MALVIDRVEADMELMPEAGAGGEGRAVAGRESDAELVERLRPLIIEILERELARLRREQG